VYWKFKNEKTILVMRNLKQSPLRIGILGCGSFAQRRILPILAELDTLQVICLQKRDIHEAKQLAAKFKIPFAVATRDDLLTHPEVEAVMITSPNHRHEEDALACAQALKPTLCEKPLAPTVTAIKKMLEAFQQRSTPLFVGHSLRFKPSIQQAKQLLQKGALGKLLQIRAHFSLFVPQDNWRYKKECGGGVLQDIGVRSCSIKSA
jgi:predicted dehydrogenase